MTSAEAIQVWYTRKGFFQSLCVKAILVWLTVDAVADDVGKGIQSRVPLALPLSQAHDVIDPQQQGTQVHLDRHGGHHPRGHTPQVLLWWGKGGGRGVSQMMVMMVLTMMTMMGGDEDDDDDDEEKDKDEEDDGDPMNVVLEAHP
jgi:hypothetical protein